MPKNEHGSYFCPTSETKANVVILNISPENEKQKKQIETKKESNKTKTNKTNRLNKKR